MAKPDFSNIPETIKVKAKLIMEILPGSLNFFKSLLIFREKPKPKAVKPSQIAIAFKEIEATCCHWTWWLLAKPIIIARAIIPKTSSMTAADKIVTPSGESNLRLSDKMRAVMPTEVAVEITPRNKGIDRKSV